jgi:hypothetical protein
MSKKALVKGALGVLIVSGSLFSLHAIGGVAFGTETDYYSDATRTEVVGNLTVLCSNKTMMDGVKTAYSREVLRWSCATRTM